MGVKYPIPSISFPLKNLEIGVGFFQIIGVGTGWEVFNSFLPQAVISEYLVFYL